MNTKDLSVPNTFRDCCWGILFAAILPTVTITIAVLGDDTLITQKVLTRWLYPLGLLYIAASAATVIALRRRQWLVSSFTFFMLLMTITATDPCVRPIAASLEDWFPEWVPTKEEPLDAAIVLGGGSGLTPRLRPQLTDSGERLALAARLYHQGAIKKLIVTGESLVDTDTARESPREQAISILTGFDIPTDAIIDLPGRTTYEEIASLKDNPELWEGKRCGLITSALHLPRAMRLAASAQVDVVAIQANYRYPNGPFTALDLIPDAENLFLLQGCIHEYLGMMIGR